MDLKKTKKSSNFEDRTSDESMNQLDWNFILGMEAFKNEGIDPHEALKGLTPQEVNDILFQKAWDAYGGTMMDNIPAGFPNKPGVNTNNRWYPMPKGK